MTTLAQVRTDGAGIQIKRFFRWVRISKAEIVCMGESAIEGTGFVELRRYVFPWRRIYFQMNWADAHIQNQILVQKKHPERRR